MKSSKLLEAIEKKGLLKEVGSNKLYREWCFLKEPKPAFKDYVYKIIDKAMKAKEGAK